MRQKATENTIFCEWFLCGGCLGNFLSAQDLCLWAPPAASSVLCTPCPGECACPEDGRRAQPQRATGTPQLRCPVTAHDLKASDFNFTTVAC